MEPSVSEYIKAHIRASGRYDLNGLTEPEVVAMLPFFHAPAVSFADWAEAMSAMSTGTHIPDARLSRSKEETYAMNRAASQEFVHIKAKYGHKQEVA